MDREQAEKALGIIRGVIENTKEDLVEHNWGFIWMLHSVTNGLAFASIGFFVERNEKSLFWYLVALGVLAAINFLIVAMFAVRDRGTRSFVEWQIHGIWTTYIIISLGGMAMIHIASLPAELFCCVISLTTSFSFSMMGVVFYRRFFAVAVAFLAIALLVANPQLRVTQWYILGGAWWVSLLVPGLILFKERKQRARGERETRIL